MFLKSKERDSEKVYCSAQSTVNVLEIAVTTHEDGDGNNRDAAAAAGSW